VIEIRDLYKYYGEKRAIGPVDAVIESGEVVGLLGLNGAGKTTTLRILACDLVPSGGTVLVDGHDVVDNPDVVKAQIGYLPDRPPVYEDMRVGEFLGFAARLRGVSGSQTRSAVGEAQDRTGLAEVRDELVGTLSHGYRQRLGIAQAIVHKPRLVILDEPISGLDPSQIVEMRKLIRGLGGDHTVLISSHILGEVSETCDRLLVIREGSIVASGSEEQLSTRFREGIRVQITIGGVDEGAGLKLLSSVAGIIRVAADPGFQSTTEMAFVVEAETDIRSELARTVIEAGHPLTELRREERDLEDIFLRLSRMATEQESQLPPLSSKRGEA
jgi:ABC-2 type transport system ATP-binding protein